MTGVCLNATKTCEVLAWCPVENDHDIPEYVDLLKYSICKFEIIIFCAQEISFVRRISATQHAEFDILFSLLPISPAMLMSAENYTLFIKNSVTFPIFGVSR